ncbi:MAG: ATP-binding protein [Bacteroidia bacterium]|nr:ATP-binding protein [Bacteroidia bacterium]
MPPAKFDKIALRDFGPIREANIELGDFTIFIGPQATGKSLLLQLIKLLMDKNFIKAELKNRNFSFSDEKSFFSLYFGGGLEYILRDTTEVRWNGSPVSLKDIWRPLKGTKGSKESVFYIPAQRVFTLRDGISRPFTDYQPTDPFVVRRFSDVLHLLIQQELAMPEGDRLFPRQKRFKETLRSRIQESIYGEYELISEIDKHQRRLALKRRDDPTSLPYMSWSAGQREFTPLLLGLLFLLPAGKKPKVKEISYVIIEELEMGLHPKAIENVLLLLLELLNRGYKVILSTHSSIPLEMVWASHAIKENQGKPEAFLNLFGLRKMPDTLNLANIAINADYEVYFFKRDGYVQRISALEVDSDSVEEASWGGLTEFITRATDVIAKVVGKMLSESHESERD